MVARGWMLYRLDCGLVHKRAVFVANHQPHGGGGTGGEPARNCAQALLVSAQLLHIQRHAPPPTFRHS